MFGPDVQLSLPPWSWFTFPPAKYPHVLPAPSPYEDEWTWKAPFAIDTKFYNDMLEAKLPLTFGAIYIVTVLLLNSINRQRGNKPFAISKSSLFGAFVLLHNLLLAIYSALTCAAMVRAVYVSFPGWSGEHGLPGAVDALCKMNGPRGFGDAITYNATSYTWASKNHKILLGSDQLTPDTTDVGRIWNEGLAFWGWCFYVSKYYEVVDNLIVILKGKRVSTLQIYHHAGALLCMWAGIRYMSPPIWMFVLINSGIHSLMYTYYAVFAAGARPARSIKQSITTLQIIQFLVGMTYAAAHLFISYSAPVPIAYTVRSIFSGVPSAVSHAAHAAAATLHSVATHAANSFMHDASSILHSGLPRPTLSSVSATVSSSAASLAAEITTGASSFVSTASASGHSLASQASASGYSLAAEASTTISALASAALANDNLWLKKLLYRAAGREALAEAIRNDEGVLFGPEFDENLIPRTIEEIREEVRYRNEYQTVRCLDSHGQAFAIWLNVLYLLPLTSLFIDFFNNTYLGSKRRSASEAAREAARRTSDTVEDTGKKLERRLDGLGREITDSDFNQFDNIMAAMKKEMADLRESTAQWRQSVEEFNANQAARRLKYNIQETIETVKKEIPDLGIEEKYEKVKEDVSNVVKKVMNVAEEDDVETEDVSSVKGAEAEPTVKQEAEHEESESQPMSQDSSTADLNASTASVDKDESTEGPWTPASKKTKKHSKKSGIPTSSAKKGPSGASTVGTSTGGTVGTSSPHITTTGTSSGSGGGSGGSSAITPRDPSTISSLASHSHIGNTAASGSTHSTTGGGSSSSHSQQTTSRSSGHQSSGSHSHMSSSSMTETSASQTFERVESGDGDEEVHQGQKGRWTAL